MNTLRSQATQTRNAKRSDSDEDSLDTFSLRNETWITDPDADDEGEASDRSKIKPQKLEQAISKAEMELKELQESYAKMKCMKDCKSTESQQTFKKQLKYSIRPKCKTKDGRSMVHKETQVTQDSESQSGGQAFMHSLRSEKKRQSQHATTSVAKNSCDADSSETEEIKRRENHIQEVIVKVESKINDMKTVLEKLILTKAQQKRDKIDNEKKWAEDNKVDLEFRNKSDFKVKIRDSSLKSKDKSETKKNKNEAESPNREKKNRNSARKTESNKSKVEIKDKHDIKDKERPSTTKSVTEDRERPRSSLSRGKRSHSAKSHGKESERKSRSHTASTDS